jgi:hypothetical protein
MKASVRRPLSVNTGKTSGGQGGKGSGAPCKLQLDWEERRSRSGPGGLIRTKRHATALRPRPGRWHLPSARRGGAPARPPLRTPPIRRPVHRQISRGTIRYLAGATRSGPRQVQLAAQARRSSRGRMRSSVLGQPPGRALGDSPVGAAEHHSELVRSLLWLEDDTDRTAGPDLGTSY